MKPCLLRRRRPISGLTIKRRASKERSTLHKPLLPRGRIPNSHPRQSKKLRAMRLKRRRLVSLPKSWKRKSKKMASGQSKYGTPSPVCVCRDNVSNQHRAGSRRGFEPAKIRMVRRTGSGGAGLRLFSRRLPIVFLIAFLFASGTQHRHTAVSDFIKVLAEIPDDFPPSGIPHVAL